MDFSKIPTDALHKFLTLLGLVILVASIGFPAAMYWQQQLRRNKLDGDMELYTLERNALVNEINNLEVEGRQLQRDLTDQLQKLREIAEDLGTVGSTGAQKADSLSDEHLQRFAESHSNVLAILTEIETLEFAGVPDQLAIVAANERLEAEFARMTDGMPNEWVRIAQMAIDGLQLTNELDRLRSVAVPDATAISETQAEIDAMERSLEQEIARVQDAEDSRLKANVLAQSMEGLSRVLVVHFELLRLRHMLTRSDEQHELRSRELQSARAALDTRVRESEILSRQTLLTVVAGVCGVLVGLICTGLGAVWWYRSDQLSLRQRVAEMLKAEAAAQDPAKKIIIE